MTALDVAQIVVPLASMLVCCGSILWAGRHYDRTGGRHDHH